MPKKRRGRPPGSKTKKKPPPEPVPPLKIHNPNGEANARASQPNSHSSPYREYSFAITESPEDLVMQIARKDAVGFRMMELIALPPESESYLTRTMAVFVREINVAERQRAAKARIA